jgi:hypothetical protein
MPVSRRHLCFKQEGELTPPGSTCANVIRRTWLEPGVAREDGRCDTVRGEGAGAREAPVGIPSAAEGVVEDLGALGKCQYQLAVHVRRSEGGRVGG